MGTVKRWFCITINIEEGNYKEHATISYRCGEANVDQQLMSAVVGQQLMSAVGQQLMGTVKRRFCITINIEEGKYKEHATISYRCVEANKKQSNILR